jgi:hypothetical protein
MAFHQRQLHYQRMVGLVLLPGVDSTTVRRRAANKHALPADADRSNMFAHVLETTPENPSRGMASGPILPEQNLLPESELISEDDLGSMPKQAPPPPFTLTFETARGVQLNMLALKVRAALQEPISVKVRCSFPACSLHDTHSMYMIDSIANHSTVCGPPSSL